MPTIYDFSLPTLNGDSTIALEQYRGRPIVIANTASKCGFTPQYEALQHIWTEFASEGLVVIGVPSNDFGNQEPGDAVAISETCHRNYGVSFPMAAKSHVKGHDAIPLFRWLSDQGGFLARPRWNFYKYIFSRDGMLSNWFTPLTDPAGPRMTQAVQRVILDR